MVRTSSLQSRLNQRRPLGTQRQPRRPAHRRERTQTSRSSPPIDRRGESHPGAGVLRGRRGQPGIADQRGDGGGGASASAHGQLRGQAVDPRRSNGLHLRAALQRGVQPELQDPAGPRLHGHRRGGAESPAAGAGQQHWLADHGQAGRQRPSGRPACRRPRTATPRVPSARRMGGSCPTDWN